MATKKIFSEKFCDIYEREDGIIYARWSGFLQEDQVKKGCSVITEYIKANKNKSHLSDHRELKVLSKEVQDYLTLKWFPEVEKAGMTKIAALVSENVFAKATVDKVNNEAKVGKLSIKSFGYENACIDWLQEK